MSDQKYVHQWLEDIVESGKCPGVAWHNYEERTFCIPWTNQKSRAWKPENFTIFKEYAKKTGQFHDGDKDDFPKWKQNLKSALNKSRFVQRKQELDSCTRTNPYRVYQFKKIKELKEKVKSISKKISSCCSTASNSSPTKVVFHTVAQSEQSGGESHAELSSDLSELSEENLLPLSIQNYSDYLNSPLASIQTDENEQSHHPNIPTTVEELVLPTSQKTAEIPASSILPHDANTVDQQLLATVRPTNITDGSVVAENTSSSQALLALTSSDTSRNIVPVMKTWGMQQIIAPDLPLICQDTFSQATNSSTPRLTAEESLKIIFGDAGGVETKATQSHGKSDKENISNVQNTYTNQSEPPRMSANHSHLHETTNAMPGNSSNLSQIMQTQPQMHTPMTQGCFSQIIQNMGNTPTQPAVTTYGMPNMLAPPGSTSTADFNNILQLPQAQQNYLAPSTGPCYDLIQNPSHQPFDPNNIPSATTHASVLNQICGEHSDITTSMQKRVGPAGFPGFLQQTSLWPQNAETCTILETSNSDTRSSTASVAEGISDIICDDNMPSLPSESQMSISLDDQATLKPTEMSIAHPGETNIAGEATPGEDSLMEITVFYGTPFKVMAHKELTVPKARIYHGPKTLASLKKNERNHGKIDYIEIPPANKAELDKDKEKKVQNIVDEFETGVAVIYDEPSRNIYAERKCIPCVYLSDGVKRSDKVERTSRSRPNVAPVKAFDFEEFEESLKLFKQNPQDNPLPRDHFILTIGHIIKVNDDSPLRSVPLYIRVRHSEAFKLRYENTPSTPSQPMMSDQTSSDLSRSLEKMSLEENKSSLDRRVN